MRASAWSIKCAAFNSFALPMTMTHNIDYSLYLVTGRELLPPGKDYLESLEESLQGGVTVVQIREKHVDTGEFVSIATASKAICDKYKIPIIINDRVDIALAIGAAGVHLGQTDMSVSTARTLLPKDYIIGVSCNDIDEVKQAIQDGADYIGIGAVWGTTTKPLTKPIIGVRNVGSMLELLDGTNIKAVAIGGIKSSNLLRTLHGSVSRTGYPLDGIAVVSEIIASSNPRLAAQNLAKILGSFGANFLTVSSSLATRPDDPKQYILQEVAGFLNVVRKTNPLIHQITNTVVATQSANITLAISGSPIMATEVEEMEDLSRICNALLINIGTMKADVRESMSKAGFFANKNRKPVVFDPVGVGASTFRKDTVKELLNTFQASVIKGNAGELAALAGSSEVASKGVDSVGSGFSDPIRFVYNLARKERCVIVLTGPVDYISDGSVVVSLHNGDEILGKITGSGCILGSCIATYCAAASSLASNGEGKLVAGNMLLGAVAGVSILNVAAEIAVRKDGSTVKGPGTFLPALIDELSALSAEELLRVAKIEVHEIP